jgi:hypothetical protein
MTVGEPHLGGHVGPGMQRPRPDPARPGLGFGSGNSCAGGTRRAELGMEPVETWHPRKVAAWLRGGWGRDRGGLEGG